MLLIERFGRMARSDQHAEGMKPAQWEALRFLSKANRLSRNPGSLAEFLSSTRGTVSQTLIALEKKGLIIRESNPMDKRGRSLALTESGQAAIDRHPIQHLEKALSAIENGAEVARELKGVMATLAKQRDMAVFGICGECAHLQKAKGEKKEDEPHHCLWSNTPLTDLNLALICREFASVEESRPQG